MTIVHPDRPIGETGKTVCSECGNDTFYCLITATARGTAKIKGIVCAICGEITNFSPAPPEEFN